MLFDAFDPSGEPIITSEMFYGPVRDLADVCIVTFSDEIAAEVLRVYPCEELAAISCCNGDILIYGFPHRGRRLAFYLSGIGSSQAATCVIEAHQLTGAEKFVMFGSAGSLDREKTAGRYVVPTAAFRDEGMSYHYAAPSDYIAVPGHARVAETFRELGVPFTEGRVWTTDAMLRETKTRMQARKSDGCLAVEMELAGVQAVCAFHGWQLYDFLQTGDVLDGDAWQYGELRDANHSLRNFQLALELATRA